MKPDTRASEVKERPYSVFTTGQKWFLVSMASLAGIFSPLTANIYFPAIPVMASQFHKSVELINLTVTVYMIMQGISPMFWGTLSDRWGRRPMFLGCLLLLSLSCVGLALTPSSAYWLLMLLRCIQAAGSASTIALGAGVIADIATPAERGGFFGLISFGPMVGPSIGPVIGGGLTQGLGWRAIFWFLCISSAVCLVVIFLFLPETLRSMVGDGSIPPPFLYRVGMIPMIGEIREDEIIDERPPRKSFNNPLVLFTYPDVVVLLILNGIYYAAFYGVTASFSTLFDVVYPFLNQTDIGLCFLAIGGGMAVGSLVTGKMLDREYRALEDKMIKQGKFDPEKKMSARDRAKDSGFPLEVARLRTMPVFMVLYLGCMVGYGWCLKAQVSIAGPLILQFIMGYAIVSIMNAVQTLLVDLAPAQGSSITACNNLIRCSLGAAMVSVVNIIIDAVGDGWTYVILAATCVAVTPLLYVEVKWGPVWRERRRKLAERA
ncbi:MFS general substrate transporter [Dentipellis sp. KUC8613]|nr:MFS general substrate transporter [Dentipellis sp. KUC8613]